MSAAASAAWLTLSTSEFPLANQDNEKVGEKLITANVSSMMIKKMERFTQMSQHVIKGRGLPWSLVYKADAGGSLG